jgi:hypothetical protein
MNIHDQAETPKATKAYLKHQMSCLRDLLVEVVVDHEKRVATLRANHFDSGLVAWHVRDLLPEEHGVVAWRDDQVKTGTELWLTPQAPYDQVRTGGHPLRLRGREAHRWRHLRDAVRAAGEGCRMTTMRQRRRRQSRRMSEWQRMQQRLAAMHARHDDEVRRGFRSAKSLILTTSEFARAARVVEWPTLARATDGEHGAYRRIGSFSCAH